MAYRIERVWRTELSACNHRIECTWQAKLRLFKCTVLILTCDTNEFLVEAFDLKQKVSREPLRNNLRIHSMESVKYTAHAK